MLTAQGTYINSLYIYVYIYSSMSKLAQANTDKLTLSNFSGRRFVRISKLRMEKEVIFWPSDYFLFSWHRCVVLSYTGYFVIFEKKKKNNDRKVCLKTV